MTSSVLKVIGYLTIFTFCIDQGDGRWREKDKENLKHDIELYKIMAEKIEREIGAFYDEYPEERPDGDSVDTTHYKHVTNTFKLYSDVNIDDKQDGGKKKKSYNPINKIKNISSHIQENLNKSNIGIQSIILKQNLTWPKFDEILLEIGKKYDWKNDRWIKVKEKLKTSKTIISAEKSKLDDVRKIKLHNLHKFSYRIVSLNRSKNRKSVVVAVTAVR